MGERVCGSFKLSLIHYIFKSGKSGKAGRPHSPDHVMNELVQPHDTAAGYAAELQSDRVAQHNIAQRCQIAANP
jgi:hypothetical protein